jgi:hypothetical protein
MTCHYHQMDRLKTLKHPSHRGSSRHFAELIENTRMSLTQGLSEFALS